MSNANVASKRREQGFLAEITLRQVITIYLLFKGISGEQKIFREFFLPRPLEPFLIILHHELARDVRLSKKSRKVELQKFPVMF